MDPMSLYIYILYIYMYISYKYILYSILASVTFRDC